MARRKRYKLDALKKAEYLTALAKGTRRGKAAESIGMSRSALAAAVRDDPDFASEVSEAELMANERVESALFRAATRHGNVTAMQVWLYNRMPDTWRDKRNLNAMDPVEMLLARLPPDLAAALRPVLGGHLPDGGAPVPGA